MVRKTDCLVRKMDYLVRKADNGPSLHHLLLGEEHQDRGKTVVVEDDE